MTSAPAPTAPAPTEKLAWLEVMRGLAALWVLGHHGALVARARFGMLETPSVIANGELGVDFFFVLSGFIIAFSSERLVARGRTLADYVRARCIRIYVPYLPVGVLLLVLFGFFLGWDRASGEISVLSSLTLLPSTRQPALSVAWTLVHEMLFYAVFSLYFVRRGLLWALLVIWGVAIAWTSYAGLALPQLAEYFLSPLNLCFLSGVLVFCTTRAWQPRASLVALFALVGVTAVVLEALRSGPHRVVSAIGFTLLVLAGSKSRKAHGAWLDALGTLGAASYSIYLVHKPVEQLVGWLLRDQALGPWTGWLIVVGVALPAGLGYWRFFERPALARVRTMLTPRAASPARTDAA